jgi:hypothetical protein
VLKGMRSPRRYNKIKIIVQGVHCLTNDADDSVIANLEEAIGDLVFCFPILHCEECAKTLKRWLKQRGIPGKLWRLSTQYDYEDFILSDRLEQQGCSETITENGVHYGVEVYGKIFDNLSREGLSTEDWVQDFTSLSNQFKVEVIEEF